uniref:Cytochrome P450 3A12-like n=1 Tax=Saccoglossus kowalevskii TaxID=10224 RepID=A0ABM0M0Y2_SACKO|nr:PREDICTED: cytochrome P450 3A12-like [Saccoglossus kowalevskii]
MYSGRTPTLDVSDPDFAKQVLIDNFNQFRNRKKPTVTQRPLDKGIKLSRNENWRHARNLLSPTFTSEKLKEMVPLLNKCAETMVKNCSKLCESNQAIEVKGIFGAYAMDCIASCAFGVEIDSLNDPNNEFVRNAKMVLTFSKMDPWLFMSLFFPFVGRMLDIFNYSVFSRKVTNFFFNETAKIIDVRKKEERPRKDFVHFMLNAHKTSSGDSDKEKYRYHGMANDEITANSLTFFLESYDTISTCLGFTSYLLATNSEVQQKLIQQIDKVVAMHGRVTYDALNDMPYLDMVISESLRMYPPAVFLERECEKDVIIKDIPIHKGIGVTINVWAIQHDSEIYPEPDKFIPERFTAEQKSKRPSCSFLAFGVGPRSCIGMQFALAECKMALVQILKRFTFETCGQTEIPLVLGKMVELAPSMGITLKFKKRQ